MAKTVLQLKNLTKRVGRKTIVQNVNFEVFEGEVFGLFGPNGAGKTTIIRSIVSLIHRTEGKVLINGKDVDTDFKGTIAEVGAIIENPEFYMYLTGWENLKQFARMSRKEISDEEINKIVDQVKLTGAIRDKVKTYSLGMRQRLGLAQALLHSPKLLILDEPTNGLDPQGMLEFRELIHDVARKGTAVLISSHLLGEMQQITHRFGIIEKGKLTHIENMSEVFENGGSKYRILVDKPVDAERLVAAKGFAVEIEKDQYISVVMVQEEVPEILKTLIEGQINVFEVSPKKASLEERFFQLTEGGTL